MTDPGQPPTPPSNQQPPTVPSWAPAPGQSAPGSSTPPPQAPPAIAPQVPVNLPDVAATMRLIPVPPPSTPPPSVAAITTPPQIPGERYIGKYLVKREL